MIKPTKIFTLKEKVKYVKKKGQGGIMFREMGHDRNDALLKSIWIANIPY